MTFGSLWLQLTNMRTGASAVVNISGPGGIDGTGLPVLARGPWAIFEPMAEGGIRYLRGVSRLVPSAYGVHAILVSGIEEDLCAGIA